MYEQLTLRRNKKSSYFLAHKKKLKYTTNNVTKIIEKLIKNFKTRAEEKYISVLDGLRIKTHSTRKTGVQLYKMLGLTEQQIKVFTGHTDKSKCIKEIYGKKTEAQKLGDIFEKAKNFKN